MSTAKALPSRRGSFVLTATARCFQFEGAERPAGPSDFGIRQFSRIAPTGVHALSALLAAAKPTMSHAAQRPGRSARADSAFPGRPRSSGSRLSSTLAQYSSPGWFEFSDLQNPVNLDLVRIGSTLQLATSLPGRYNRLPTVLAAYLYTDHIWP